jgi:transcriptional regulator with XRE-family HTH domain
MDTYGKRMAALRKERKMTQQELAKLLNTSISVVEVAKNIAGFLDTTVGYLLGEAENADLFKDPAMLQRLSDLEKLDDKNKSHILSVLDGFLQSVKIKNIAAL